MANYCVRLFRTQNIGEQYMTATITSDILNNPDTGHNYSPYTNPTSDTVSSGLITDNALNGRLMANNSTVTYIFAGGQYISMNKASNGRYTLTAVMSGYNASYTSLPSSATNVYIGVVMNDTAQKAQLFVITDVVLPPRYVDYNTVGPYSNDLWLAMKGFMPPEDPYKNGGTSEEDGGGGDQTFSSDSIGEPSAPSLSPQGSRLLTLYKVDSTILKDFANYLWAGGIDFATLHNIFNDTMGAVISLAVCPFTPSGNTPQNLWFGNFDSGVSATLVDSQYATVDCGTLSLDEEYKSALDYNPYCKIELCLPYCGNVALDPDEFMGTDISIKYKIDLLTGACIACVFADGNLLLTVPGNVLASVPVTNADHKAIVSSVAGTAISVAGAALAVATGGMSAPAAATTAATASAANTLNMKERYSHGGTGNANTALLGPQKPYVIIKWPRQCLPENNANYQGYPSMITESLGDLIGFTQVHKIHLEGISATQTEMMELEAALREGVIL